MNSIKITYYIHNPKNGAATGNCKTLSGIKKVASKHGVSMIYARQNGAVNGAPCMVKGYGEQWRFLSASEDDFFKS